MAREDCVLSLISVSAQFLSEPLFVEWLARFTTAPLKALSDQVWIRYPAMFIIVKANCFLSAVKPREL